MKKSKKKRLERVSLKLICTKINDWDLDQMKRKAAKHAEGNLSAWIRYASRMYTPKTGERVSMKAS